MNAKGEKLSEGRISHTGEEVAEMLTPSGGEAELALEACGLWLYVHDLDESQGVAVSLAHPRHVKAKTDKVELQRLADGLGLRLRVRRGPTTLPDTESPGNSSN